MGNVCAKESSFGFAGPGAMAFGKGNKSSSPSDNDNNGTAIRGKASQLLSHGPSKVTQAPDTPGFDAILQHGQQISGSKMDIVTMEIHFKAPFLWEFIEAFVQDMPVALKKVYKLDHSWNLRYLRGSLEAVLQRCKGICAT